MNICRSSFDIFVTWSCGYLTNCCIQIQPQHSVRFTTFSSETRLNASRCFSFGCINDHVADTMTPKLLTQSRRAVQCLYHQAFAVLRSRTAAVDYHMRGAGVMYLT